MAHAIGPAYGPAAKAPSLSAICARSSTAFGRGQFAARAFVLVQAVRRATSGTFLACPERTWRWLPLKRRILVVDDDAELRGAVSEFLLGEGFDVVEADNGGTALAAARTDTPDVLLLDLNMPQVDGSAVLEEWTASPRLKSIPVVLVSASPGLAEIARRHDVRASLAKPFDMDVLRTVIERLLANPMPRPDG